ncbi:MAG: 5'/3'-nucleotidase SurE [Candidatus Latescibacteria bacterium]|nr:5'/3'-nucleotidase SurE [Candidatus Latescibacterota bacterium]MCK5381636.1 5'/3'-nucleotidase SurE [Candidatus Latescibacterota bacterium]
MKQRPYILLTNDDGINAQGLAALRKAFESFGDVMVAAPDRECSAAGHAITLRKPIRVHQIDKTIFEIEGTPTDCVLIAICSLMDRRPDLVISGINHGPNLGDDVTYSGTVGAAMEGALWGIPSVAISVVGQEHGSFRVAARIGVRLAKQFLQQKGPRNLLLNVNVPDLPEDRIRGVRVTKLGRRGRFAEELVTRKTDAHGAVRYWIGGEEPAWIGDAQTDTTAIEEGYVSVTPLRLDWTHDETMASLDSWEDLAL